MRTFSFALLLLFAIQATAQAERPNILILYADDLGYGDLTVQNPDSKIPTPNLDRLAKAGIRFLDGHSSSGICTPSRYALLTGRHHWRDFHGIVNAFGASPFPPERLTLSAMLKEKGYHTAAIGKWHLGWDWDAIRRPGKEKGNHFTDFDWSKSIPGGPLDHGFDTYFGDTVINFPPYCWIENDKVVDVPDTMMDVTKWKPIKEGNWECRPGPMFSGWDPYENIPTTTAKAVEYLHTRKDAEEPFFLYFCFPSPHAPIIPNDRFDGKSQAGPYGDFVVETDDACGQILKALEESGLADNTIVIFTADNGPEHYAYARDRNFNHWSSEPLRGLKRDIYEGGHRVPYMIRWPGVVEAGRVSDALVSQIDLMATLAEVVDYKLPADSAEDSHNLLPHLKGETDTVRTTHIHNTAPNKYAIRHGEWLLVDAPTGYISRGHQPWAKKRDYPADESPVQLFHLAKDIGQRNNLAEKHPEKVDELRQLLGQIREQGYSAPRLGKASE